MQTFHAHLYPTGSKWQVEVTPDLPIDDHDELAVEDPTAEAVVAHTLDVPADAPVTAVQAAAERALLSKAGEEWYVHRWAPGNGEMLGRADRERPYAHRGQLEQRDGSYQLVIRRPISLVLADNTEHDEIVDDDLAAPVVIPLPGLADMEDVHANIGWMARTHGWHVMSYAGPTGRVQMVRERPTHRVQITCRPDGRTTFRIDDGKPRLSEDLPLPPAAPGEDPRATAERVVETKLRKRGFRLVCDWARLTSRLQPEESPLRLSTVYTVRAGKEGLGPYPAPIPAPAGWVTDRLRTPQDVIRIARNARLRGQAARPAAGGRVAWTAWLEAVTAAQEAAEGLPADYLADVATATWHTVLDLIEEAASIIEAKAAEDADKGIWQDPDGWDCEWEDEPTVAEYVRYAAVSAISEAAYAATVRDKISADHYAILTKPFHQDES